MMRRAYKLLVLRERLVARHWGRRDWLNAGFTIAIAVVTFLAAKKILAGVEAEMQMLAVFGLIEITFLLGFVFAAANFMKSWFSSPDAFYLMTLPTPVREMYGFHYLDIVLKFLKSFGHLLVPLSLSFGLVIGGWPGAMLLLGAFLLSGGLAVECGFLYMFFVFRGTNLLLRSLGGALAGLLVMTGAVWLGLTWPLMGVGVSIVLIITIFWQTPSYAKKAIFAVRKLAAAGLSFLSLPPGNAYWQKPFSIIIICNRAFVPSYTGR